MKFDGVALAQSIYSDQQRRVHNLLEKGITPHLAVLLVGDDPASKLYIAQKKKWGSYIGANVSLFHYPQEITTGELLQKIADLNTNPSIHGIIVQRPLPAHIDKDALAIATEPMKDIDGFHPHTTFVIPVAAAVVKILEEIYNQTTHSHPNFQAWLQEITIVTVGKGDTAGKPIIDYLKKCGANPIIVGRQTTNPAEVIKQGNVVISSVGRTGIINAENINKGAILIGVGITKDREEAIRGDYNEDEIKEIASFYTPTPGGVGPVNVAFLLDNLVTAAEYQSREQPQQ
jgi:methylenetetrahydrofolate dehydrogenase (NADP+)/methenyltetrahydrofolate cyclohydrolase